MTQNYAYFLGWMYSDGCITSDKRCNSKTVKIKIKSSDEEVFTHFSDITDWKKGYLNNGKYVCLHKTNLELATSLINLGVLERKSYENKNNLKLPKLDDSLMPFFIRGFFDGDGTYYYANKQTYLLYTECVSASQSFIEELSSYLLSKGIDNKIKIEGISKSRKQPIYKISIRKRSEVKKFIDFVYGTNPQISLSRKYLLVKEFLNNYKTNSEIYKEVYINTKHDLSKYITPEVRKQAMQTRSNNFSAGKTIPSMKGKHHSNETKQKIREARLQYLAQVKQRELLESLEDNNATT